MIKKDSDRWYIRTYASKVVLFVSLLIIVIIVVQNFIFIRTETAYLQDRLIEDQKSLNELLAINLGVAQTIAGFAFQSNLIKEAGEISDTVYVRFTKPNGEIYLSNIVEERGAVIRDPAINTDKTVVKDDVYKGESIKVVVSPVSGGYTVWLGFSLNSVHAAVNERVRDILLVSIVILIIGNFIAYFIAKRMTRPLKELRKGVEVISKGNLNYKVDVKTRDEVGQLASTFNQMVSDLRTSTTSIDNLNKEIAGRKQAEEALANEAIRRRILIEQSSDGIVILDQNGKVYEVNRRFAEMLGYSSEEVLQLHVWDWEFLVPREQVLDMIRSVDETGDHFETQHIRKDGTIYDVEISTNGAVFAGQKLIFCVCRDITKRKRAEEALRESEEKFSKAFHTSPDLITITTLKDGTFIEVNDTFTRFSGYTREEAIGHSSAELDLWPETEERDRLLKKLREQGRASQEELHLRTKSGEIRTGLFSAEPINIGGEPCIIVMTTDITERKRAEEKLKHAISNMEHSGTQLAATNKELEAFSYSVSHDLRAPLRSIDGFSQALLEDYPDKLDKQGKDYLRRLRAASQKMGELIDGLQKLSRLTRSEMHKEEVDLSALAEEITTRLQEAQPERQVKVAISRGLTASGDRQLLRALLENLLGNAWKFTGKRRQARIEFGATQNGDRKAYFVRDNGAGFDMTYADKLFSAFQRLHETTEFPGTGIGLATVRRIINRHGGSVWAEGVVGKGATFYFTLN